VRIHRAEMSYCQGSPLGSVSLKNESLVPCLSGAEGRGVLGQHEILSRPAQPEASNLSAVRRHARPCDPRAARPAQHQARATRARAARHRRRLPRQELADPGAGAELEPHRRDVE
jgi:hypothetical protein